jgi:hypothetical protein
VLADPHERSWYDAHREAILRGQKPGAGAGGKSASGEDGVPEDPSGLNLFDYFSTSCYGDYNDGPDGFYTVYASLFEKIDQVEMEAMKEAGQEETRSVSACYQPLALRTGCLSSHSKAVLSFFAFSV